jgi:hypothetical protein
VANEPGNLGAKIVGAILGLLALAVLVFVACDAVTG